MKSNTTKSTKALKTPQRIYVIIDNDGDSLLVGNKRKDVTRFVDATADQRIVTYELATRKVAAKPASRVKTPRAVKTSAINTPRSGFGLGAN